MSSHSNEGSGDGSTNRISRGEFQKGIYGPPQFTEADVLACLSEAEREEQGRMFLIVILLWYANKYEAWTVNFFI